MQRRKMRFGRYDFAVFSSFFAYSSGVVVIPVAWVLPVLPVGWCLEERSGVTCCINTIYAPLSWDLP